MSDLIEVEIGWLPLRFQKNIGNITIDVLPNFDEAIAAVEGSDGIERGWIYAPPREQRVMGHGFRTLPYPSRVFGLPKTHRLLHRAADGDAHIGFIVWALSFIFGLRLTATEAGFLDATPIQTGTLTDFVLGGAGPERAIALADRFWQANAAKPSRAKRLGAVIHALMLSQGPQLLQFEEFIYLYGALDSCFALASDLHGPVAGRVRHTDRIAWMCAKFGMAVPDWGKRSSRSDFHVANLRNDTLHESLFMDAPLGFALHGVGTGSNLMVEMQALICRLVVALLGDSNSEYVRTAINTRMQHSWNPST